MKKRCFCWLLAVSMLLCAGCGKRPESAAEPKSSESAAQTEQPAEPAAEPQAEPQTEQETGAWEEDHTADLARFAPVLDEICDVIYNGFREENDYPFVPSGVIEVSAWSDGADAADTLGFSFVDLNGDGENELLIVEDEDLVVGGYAVADGEPVCFLEGWSRNAYGLLDDNRIFNQGSGGWAYSMWGVYRLNDAGTELVCEDMYFTELEEGTDDQIIVYHNTTGEWDPGVSERVDGGEDVFWEKAEAYSFVTPKLTPLSAYDYTGPLNQPLDCKVRADYEEDVSWFLPEGEAIGDYFPALAPTGDPYEISVVFRSKEGVEDFKLLSLALEDVDAAGNAVFAVTELCSLPELKADVPLTVPMTFPGDMPTSGFSYVDHGTQKQYSLSQSGRDGALVVTEIRGN